MTRLHDLYGRAGPGTTTFFFSFDCTIGHCIWTTKKQPNTENKTEFLLHNFRCHIDLKNWKCFIRRNVHYTSQDLIILNRTHMFEWKTVCCSKVVYKFLFLWFELCNTEILTKNDITVWHYIANSSSQEVKSHTFSFMNWILNCILPCTSINKLKKRRKKIG